MTAAIEPGAPNAGWRLLRFAGKDSDMILRTLGAATLIACVSVVPTAAQERPPRIVTLGLGVQMRPGYPGADNLRLAPLPVVRVRREGQPIPLRAPDDGATIRAIGSEFGWSAGGTFNFQGDREDEDVGAAVGDVGFTVEPGLFVQGYLRPDIRFRAEGRRGVGGHDAFTGDVSLDYVLRTPGDRFVGSIGPRVRLGDARYQRAYFGVTDDAAVATRLPAYRPGGGLHATGVAAGGLYQFNERWGVFAYAGYDRLVGDAADSPLVRRFGSRDQASGGIALTYTFRP